MATAIVLGGDVDEATDGVRGTGDRSPWATAPPSATLRFSCEGTDDRQRLRDGPPALTQILPVGRVGLPAPARPAHRRTA